MATREGIYVGGHEIVERYVGSRLVWEKFVLVAKGTYDFRSVSEPEGNFLFVTNRSSVFSSNHVFQASEIDGSTMVKKGDVSFTNIVVKKYVTSYGYENGSFTITFNSTGDKNRFINLSGETKFYKKRGN